jgi:hypothetical protein
MRLSPRTRSLRFHVTDDVFLDDSAPGAIRVDRTTRGNAVGEQIEAARLFRVVEGGHERGCRITQHNEAVTTHQIDDDVAQRFLIVG